MVHLDERDTCLYSAGASYCLLRANDYIVTLWCLYFYKATFVVSTYSAGTTSNITLFFKKTKGY